MKTKTNPLVGLSEVEKDAKLQDMLKSAINVALMQVHNPFENGRFCIDPDEKTLLEDLPNDSFASLGVSDKMLKEISKNIGIWLGIEVGSVGVNVNMTTSDFTEYLKAISA